MGRTPGTARGLSPERIPPQLGGAALSSRAVARTWQELFVVAHNGSMPPEPAAELEERRGGFFRRLRENLAKSRQALGAELQATIFQTLDDEAWERLEETLIHADVGAATTARIVARLELEADSGELVAGEAVTGRLRELLADAARTGEDTIDLRAQPTVILVVGVNGTGKTTTIGKMAWHLKRELGRSVLLLSLIHI